MPHDTPPRRSGKETEMNANTRTYLCPDCDGWGAIEGNDGPTYVGGTDPQHDWQKDCIECCSTGVIEATYADGEMLDLTPWTGSRGRVLQRNRAPAFDWFAYLAATRAICAQRHIRSVAYHNARQWLAGKSPWITRGSYAQLEDKIARINAQPRTHDLREALGVAA